MILKNNIVSGEIAQISSLILVYKKLFAPSPRNSIDING
jgi:hypothetical protein